MLVIRRKGRCNPSAPEVSIFRKEVVGDAIPGVMNSIEEQQQRRRSNPKEGLSRRCLLTSDLCPLFTFYFLISLARRSLGQGGYFPFLYAHRRKS